MSPVITVNPNAEVSNFQAVQPGVYPLRIADVEDRRPEKTDLHITIEHVRPDADLIGRDGNPLTGKASRMHTYPSLLLDKQGMLRAVVEAVGLEWSDFDTDDLKGREFMANVTEEEYKGNWNNKIGRFVQPESATAIADTPLV